MPDILTSFHYDPVRQGYDTNSWRTIYGAPRISSGRLLVDGGEDVGSAIHYGDITKGDISFNISVPTAPGGNATRLFGVAAPSIGAYIRFSFGTTLTAQCSNGTTTTTSAEIPWDTNLNGTNVTFNIRWEAGAAKFFIQGAQVACISDASVPNGALSLYFYDDSGSPMSIGGINVRGTQSFVMNLATSDLTSFTGDIISSQLVTVSENITIAVPVVFLPMISETVTVTEDTGALNLSIKKPFIFETVTITEDFAATIV